MNDNLICNSCILAYNIELRRPMVLPCGHTLCSRCLDNIRDTKGFIKCPHDRKKFHHIKDNILINPFVLNQIQSKNKQIINELIEKSERDIFQKDQDRKLRIIHKTHNFSFHGNNSLNAFESAKVSILFTYFDVISSFIGIIDKLEFQSKYLVLPLKLLGIILVFFLNYIFIAYKAFMKVFMFIILINDSRKKIKTNNKLDIILCIKRWISFMTIVLLDEVANYTLSIFNISLFWFIWNCILTIYVVVTLGPNSTVDLVIDSLYKVLDKMKLLA